MKITASDYYHEHHQKPYKNGIGQWVFFNCEAGNRCKRYYCSGKTHRLLYRTCESVLDRDDSGSCFSGECPQCHEEYESRKYREEALALDRAIESDAFPDK